MRKSLHNVKRKVPTMANVSRRDLFKGALTAGLAASAAPMVSAQTPAPQRSRPGSRAGLPDVWGQDFLYQWSPPANVKRDLTAGPAPIRLSNPGIVNREGTDYAALFKSMRDGGWTACEAASAGWLSRKVPD